MGGELPLPIDVSLEALAPVGYVKALLDYNPGGVVVIDTSGEIAAFNRAARAMFGYRIEEVRGKNVSILMPAPDSERHDDYIRSYLTTGQKKIMGIGRQVTARHKDGHTFPVFLEIGEATVGDRRMFLGFLEDVSESEEQRRKIRLLSSELAHASRITSMGMLANAIAHEINQPLAAIRNYVETIAEMAEGPNTIDREVLREAMQACAAETARAGEIIRRFRHFISTGDVEKTRVSLSAIVGEALGLALADGEGANVAVNLQIDADADTVLADPVELQQVIFNLVRNAKQAMASTDHPKVQVSSHADAESVEVMVEDNGPGLDGHDLEELIKPFHSSKSGGLGIGLSICRAIVEGHGGHLWATQSQLGGAAFHFTIPRLTTESERKP